MMRCAQPPEYGYNPKDNYFKDYSFKKSNGLPGDVPHIQRFEEYSKAIKCAKRYESS